jgi:hypothetical protein
MLPKTRKVARLVNDLESVATRLKNLVPDLESMELAERSFFKASQVKKQAPAEELFEEQG